MDLYFGDLHNHTGYSDGRLRPEQAYGLLAERGRHDPILDLRGASSDAPLRP